MTFILLIGLAHGCASPDRPTTQRSFGPFEPDKYTVALYHFDEGTGDLARDACGDPALTLQARKQALWGSHPGFGTTARFVRTDDDANLLIGPVNNDKLQLRTCTKEWTVEAWVKYTGPYGKDWGNTYANIFGSDEEGLSLPEGRRGGWHLALHNSRAEKGLAPMARFIGSHQRDPDNDVNQISPYFRPQDVTDVRPSTIQDPKWHHVAWQFRYADQMHYLLIDGKVVWKVAKPDGKSIKNDAERCDIPFHVGGFLHSQDQSQQHRLRIGNFEGEIDQIRISSIMRYPVANRLAIIRRDLPSATASRRYRASLATDASAGKVAWKLVDGRLPDGLALNSKSGVIAGTPEEISPPVNVTIRATDSAGHSDEHSFSIQVNAARILTESLPLAFAGVEYDHQLKAEHLAGKGRWRIICGKLPAGMRFNRRRATLTGTPVAVASTTLRVEVTDAGGHSDQVDLLLKVVSAHLRHIEPDEHTVAMWDWQGPNAKLIKDLMGDESLTLTWTNIGGDRRLPRKGWGVYPNFIGAGEHGFVGPQHSDKLDLRTCTKQWTVEMWLRRGGPLDMHGRKFDYGHVCGTYDNTKRGVWELYLSDQDSPDGSMAPGVHFLGAEDEQALMDLHPWKRPDGIVGDAAGASIRDTEWHHVAWQYDYESDRHELFLDGELIWRMKSPDGRKLVNNRKHDAQFSICTRLKGFARYGGAFNYLGWGNYFGQIGEIRISNVRRYDTD